MKIALYPGFSYKALSKGRCRLFWRESGRQVNRTYKSRALMEEALKTLYPRFASSRVNTSEVAKADVDLRDATDRLCARLALSCANNPESTYAKQTKAELYRICDSCGWNVLGDITLQAISDYYLDKENAERLGAVEGELKKLKVLFDFLLDEDVHVPRVLRKFPIPERSEKKIRVRWTLAEKAQWWSFLIAGIEVLAKMGASLSWHERIQIACHTIDFERRMRIVAMYLVQHRYLYRPGETRRLTAACWHSEQKILHLPKWASKTGREKISFVDDETAWILDAWTLGAHPGRKICLNGKGRGWGRDSLCKATKRLLINAGLPAKMPYDYKYNVSPDLLEDEKLDAALRQLKWSLVQDLMGHTRGSGETKRYAFPEELVPTPEMAALRAKYNAVRLLPFRVSDYPICWPSVGSSGHVAS